MKYIIISTVQNLKHLVVDMKVLAVGIKDLVADMQNLLAFMIVPMM